jgi:uncharacterized ferredoxin-like protein
MAIFDGNKAASEYLVEVAKACILAANRAPALTIRLGVKTEILTGEDVVPLIDVMQTLGKAAGMLEMEGATYRNLLDAKEALVIVLFGADLTKAVGWDCGGCGFPNCAEFTKYVKTSKGQGAVALGPSCLWKAIDFGIAADYACACAAMHRLETRIQFTMGSMAMLLGRLEGCSLIVGLPLGPGSNIWFDRQGIAGLYDYEHISKIITATSPNLQMTFTGVGTPMIKTKQRWWEAPTFLKVEEDKEIIAKKGESLNEVMKKISEYRHKVSKEKK